MKHLVIFLNYCQSRLDNPVYRIFATESLYRRNTTLLFLQKPLEERELTHEVAELRKKQTRLDDVTFHVCSNLTRPVEGELIISTINMIRRLFPADVDHHYPTFVYGQMPCLMDSEDDVRKTIWRNLVVINNAVADHFECRLLTNVYLFNDDTQKSLAEFIFNICHSEISFDKLSARLPVKQGDLFRSIDSESVDFPPIFGGFNTLGITYPEIEIKTHLQYFILQSALRCSLPSANATEIEKCNTIAQEILSKIPFSTPRLCLQEESFLNIDSDDNSRWSRVDTYWRDSIEIQTEDLSNYPRVDWLARIRQRVDALNLGRFRDIGTDYFFKVESKKTVSYCSVLSAIIIEEFDNAVQVHLFTPEAQKIIIRGIINILQQKVIEIQSLKTVTESIIDQIENELNDINLKWNSLNLFNRLMRKDTQVLEAYKETITRLMIKKTLVPGCDFAIKLLNELIPAVSSLLERCDNFQRILNEALQSVEEVVRELNPSDQFGVFDTKDLQLTYTAIETDSEFIMKEYALTLSTLLKEPNIADGDELLSHIRTGLNEKVEEYISQRIDDCSIPPILGMSIVDRISRLTEALGGITNYIEGMKRKTPISISIKKSCTIQSKNLLISPELPETIEGVEHLLSEDFTHLQLLHIRYGLTLQDLDGFAGQKMFVEPSIF